MSSLGTPSRKLSVPILVSSWLGTEMAQARRLRRSLSQCGLGRTCRRHTDGVKSGRRLPSPLGSTRRWPSRTLRSTSWRSSSLRRLSRPGTVPKSDVIARLCASAVPLVSVVAPAGYGKTTLLASWAEADPRPFAWVALDRRDDDAVVLPALHRGRGRPSRAAAGRGVRRVVGPRGVELGLTRPARWQRAGRARAPAGAGARRSARRRQSILPGRARRAAPLRAGRFADRDREP